MTLDLDKFNKLAEACLEEAYNLREDSSWEELAEVWKAGRSLASAARTAMRLRKAADSALGARATAASR